MTMKLGQGSAPGISRLWGSSLRCHWSWSKLTIRASRGRPFASTMMVADSPPGSVSVRAASIGNLADLRLGPSSSFSSDQPDGSRLRSAAATSSRSIVSEYQPVQHDTKQTINGNTLPLSSDAEGRDSDVTRGHENGMLSYCNAVAEDRAKVWTSFKDGDYGLQQANARMIDGQRPAPVPAASSRRPATIASGRDCSLPKGRFESAPDPRRTRPRWQGHAPPDRCAGRHAQREPCRPGLRWLAPRPPG